MMNNKNTLCTMAIKKVKKQIIQILDIQIKKHVLNKKNNNINNHSNNNKNHLTIFQSRTFYQLSYGESPSRAIACLVNLLSLNNE